MKLSCEEAILAVDVEGNGQSPPEVVELAIVPIYSDLSFGPPRSWLIRPNRKVTWHASKLHGITNKELSLSPSLPEVLPEIMESLGSSVLVAHNASVDYRAIKGALPSWRPRAVLDTLKLSRLLLPGLPSHKLSSMIAHFELEEVLKDCGYSQHRATYDAVAAAEIFLKLLNLLPSDTSDLQKLESIAGVVTDKKYEQGTLF